MAVCCNKVMVVVVVQIEQKMERGEIGDMEQKNRRNGYGGEKREASEMQILTLRMNTQMFRTTPSRRKWGTIL